jgi:enolase
MKSFKISDIQARQILDCRGNPTVQVDVVVDDYYIGTADVPAGMSTGANEAKEIRDGGKEYNGLGVTKAVKNVKDIIAPALKGEDVTKQRHIDSIMIELDGSKDKAALGANAIVGVSLAVARASANVLKMPLYKYININAHILPVPLINLINGGKHASNDLEFQEFCIFPIGAESFSEAMVIGHAVNTKLKEIIIKQYGKIAANVGDEGGFAPPITSVREAMDCLVLAVERSGYSDKIVYGLDCAATHIFNRDSKKYSLEGNELDSRSMVDYYAELINDYPIVTLEDPLSEDDVEGFIQATERLGIQIVGDDFFCTNPQRIKDGSEKGAGNALLWKFNQIGTLTEALDAADIAAKNAFDIMVSERSGETEDAIIADLVVGLNAGQIKTGAPVRGERTAKYNRLLKIEEELGTSALYAGNYLKDKFKK